MINAFRTSKTILCVQYISKVFHSFSKYVYMFVGVVDEGLGAFRREEIVREGVPKHVLVVDLERDVERLDDVRAVVLENASHALVDYLQGVLVIDNENKEAIDERERE